MTNVAHGRIAGVGGDVVMNTGRLPTVPISAAIDWLHAAGRGRQLSKVPVGRAFALACVCLSAVAPRAALAPALPVETVDPSRLAMLRPLPLITPAAPTAAAVDVRQEVASLRAAMAREVEGLVVPTRRAVAEAASRADRMLRVAGRRIESPQLVAVVDRSPAVQRLYLMLAAPGGPGLWRLIGAARVSTGQTGRKDHYVTPVGAFAHTDAILDFRARGTFNEHHVRGLGLAGMRVWDFGWQWALKGWHTDGEGGDIRLQMHATDPDLLERRLGRPASEGCVRISASLNRFLDGHGVLDADYERAAVQDIRYNALLRPDRTPTPLAGRLLVVIDTGRPPDDPPTVASRPAGWPPPDHGSAQAAQPGTL